MTAPTSGRAHALVVGVVWAVLTVVGIALVLGLPLMPPAASREARVVDNAFLVLLAVSVPVFVLVQVLIVYSALRYRAQDDGDGPPIAGHRALTVGWVLVTLLMVSGLAAFGWTGMEELRGERADLRVKVVGSQFAWRFDYVDLGFSSTELRLPKDRTVRFEVTSTDVIHSFWIPSFRVKQDAVPGRTLHVTATPTELVRDDVLCAELCGVGHTIMRAPVEVMEPSAFDAWAAQKKAAVAR